MSKYYYTPFISGPQHGITFNIYPNDEFYLVQKELEQLELNDNEVLNYCWYYYGKICPETYPYASPYSIDKHELMD